jgi:hypothetical protein
MWNQHNKQGKSVIVKPDSVSMSVSKTLDSFPGSDCKMIKVMHCLGTWLLLGNALLTMTWSRCLGSDPRTHWQEDRKWPAKGGETRQVYE